MKGWLITAIYLHVVFAGASVFGWSPAVVVILCLLGIGVVLLLAPTGPDGQGASLLARTLKRMR